MLVKNNRYSFEYTKKSFKNAELLIFIKCFILLKNIEYNLENLFTKNFKYFIIYGMIEYKI